MKKIIIVDAHSTTLNYLHDCEKLNIEPIILTVPFGKQKRDGHSVDYTMFGDKMPKVLDATDSYEETLNMVKKEQPMLILPSGEDVVELSCQLSEELGLPTNKLDNMKHVINKFDCQTKIRKAGLRSIETMVIPSYEGLKDFFKKHNENIVIKPMSGTASVGVHMCTNMKQLDNAWNAIQELKTHPGWENSKFLMQERMNGGEFAVNTCSCNGKHKITSIWLYEKIVVPGFAPYYQRFDFLRPNDKIVPKLVQFVFSVLDALGIQMGPCHTEIIVDGKGPALMEVNSRIPGATLRWQFLDQVLGHHETDVSLMSYLTPEKFLDEKTDFFNPIAYATVKFIDLPHDIFVIKPTVDEFCKQFSSYFCYNLVSTHPLTNFLYPKTINMDTAAGCIYLFNKDKDKLVADRKVIVEAINNNIEKLFEIK